MAHNLMAMSDTVSVFFRQCSAKSEAVLMYENSRFYPKEW